MISTQSQNFATPVDSGAGPSSRTESGATSPAERLLSRYLAEAVSLGASDLHIEPEGSESLLPSPASAFSGSLCVRARVDGRLRNLEAPPKSLARPLTTRLRLLAGADLSEQRLPQDGRFSVEIDHRSIDVRAAFMPVLGGERVTLRFLAGESTTLRFDELGFSDLGRLSIERFMGSAGGMMIVTGPTGSGKTTTLYATIERLSRPYLSVITVEDPIERKLAGVTQIQVQESVQRDFPCVLRSVLRHDPDVLFVGEIRDGESARVAARAALTGHKVLSTLHSTTAGEAVTRLTDLGLEPHLVRATISVVINQRLVRQLCRACKRVRPIETTEKRVYDGFAIEAPAELASPVGCDQCDSEGYKGRFAVFDVVDRSRSDKNESGSLAANGLYAAAAHQTTVEEILSICPVETERSGDHWPGDVLERSHAA